MINNLMETPSVSNVPNTTDRDSSMVSSNSNTSSSNNMRSLLKVKKEVVTPTTGPMMEKSIIRTMGVSAISSMIISKGSRKSWGRQPKNKGKGAHRGNTHTMTFLITGNPRSINRIGMLKWQRKRRGLRMNITGKVGNNGNRRISSKTQ
jgi:hypothetical protein